jgi:hypothetical protein
MSIIIASFLESAFLSVSIWSIASGHALKAHIEGISSYYEECHP